MLYIDDKGKGFILNPYSHEIWIHNRNVRRRALFKQGILEVKKTDSNMIVLYCKGHFVGCWSNYSNSNDAISIIDTAFNTFEALYSWKII